MKISQFLLIAIASALTAPFAFPASAELLNSRPTGLNVGYNGVEAQNLINALSPYVGKSMIAPSQGHETDVFMMYVRDIRVTINQESSKDPANFCFKKPSYKVVLTDWAPKGDLNKRSKK